MVHEPSKYPNYTMPPSPEIRNELAELEACIVIHELCVQPYHLGIIAAYYLLVLLAFIPRISVVRREASTIMFHIFT